MTLDQVIFAVVVALVLTLALAATLTYRTHRPGKDQ